MKKENFIFSGNNKRLDIFLKEKYPDISRELLKKLIIKGFILLNGKLSKPAEKLRNGDLIQLNIPENNETKLKNFIIYEDSSLIILHKPSGLLVHPTDSNWLKDPEILKTSQETLTLMLYQQYLKEKIELPPRLGIVHRLDRETSGIMVVAKNERAFKNLTSQFEQRQVLKTYLGVVIGKIKKKHFIIDAPIGRKSGDKKLSVWKYGRQAITEIKLIKSNNKYSYLEIKPMTGRTNQIRVHLAFIHTPILGDQIYSCVPFERLMLHSYKLKFKHPQTLKIEEFKAEPDEHFKSILKKIFD